MNACGDSDPICLGGPAERLCANCPKNDITESIEVDKVEQKYPSWCKALTPKDKKRCKIKTSAGRQCSRWAVLELAPYHRMCRQHLDIATQRALERRYCT